MSRMGGVSRSGRVRKRSSKLLDMEVEAVGAVGGQPLAEANNGGNNLGAKSTPKTPQTNSETPADTPTVAIAEDTDVKIAAETPPTAKKLKFKLCLNPSPAIKPNDNKSTNKEIIGDPVVSETPKPPAIPPLKIPRSKITSLVVPNCIASPVVVETSDDSKATEAESPAVPVTPSDRKTKTKSRRKSDKKSSPKVATVSPKADTDVTIDVVMDAVVNDEENITVTPAEDIDVNETPVVSNGQPIVETPKASKASTKSPKARKESPPKPKESAVNRLFRQITSGVTPSPPKSSKAKGNKRNKHSLPLEDVTQISIDDEFAETSLIIDADDVPPVVVAKPKPKRRRPSAKSSPDGPKTPRRPTKRGSKSGAGDSGGAVDGGDEPKPKKKRNAVITAYMIWSKEHRSKIQQKCPAMDFADISRKLGEIWQSMPEKEKVAWRRKAQKLVTKGSSIISTGKPKPAPHPSSRVKNRSPPVDPLALTNDDYLSYTSIDDLWEPIGTAPIDVSSHLKLLGESLTTIGERLKEHSGQIAVSGSLSVLLDSTLCAIGPLLCLTQLDPYLNGCSQETHKKTLDNIAYIMPGI